MTRIERPGQDEASAYLNTYIDRTTGEDLLRALQAAAETTWDTVYRLPTGHGDHRYAEGKWSIKEVFQHVMDTERIFGYRALCFARGETAELPGFDENTYAVQADAGRREIHQLMREHDALRNSTIELFRSFSPEMLLRAGTANGSRISVRALGWAIVGHTEHHMRIINERYLPT